MDDDHRVLERKAILNVRSLFERLERDDLRHRNRQWRWVLIAVIPILAFLGLVLAFRRDFSPPLNQTKLCEQNAWNARAAEFERNARQSNPNMPYREIQEKLEHERAFIMAAARVDCNSKAL